MPTSGEASRLAQEVNLRRVNEAIERGRREDGSATFVCECGRLGCNTTLRVALDDYRAVRTASDRFLVAAGDDEAGVDRVVETRGSYVVVVKDVAAALAVADPRRAGA